MEKVNFEGKTYTLTQEAYIDGPADGAPFFRAAATDNEGSDYEVKWEVIEGREDVEDMQEMCEWDKPVSVEKI